MVKVLIPLYLYIGFVFFSCQGSSSTDPNENDGIFCPPCNVQASEGMIVTPGQDEWPVIVEDKLIKINSLTKVLYNQSIESVWGETNWWMQNGNDPWSEYPYWGSNYVPPTHQFDECVDDGLRWKCGYSYVVKIPTNYNSNDSYPLVIFLHGGFDQSAMGYDWYHYELRDQIHMPTDDPFIYVAPIKLEVDWDAKKVQDVLENVKDHLNVNDDRVYLTGLSMGGRGTFIVAAQLPNYFAGLMPLSPHHGPYSYLPLADKVAHLPIWMSHGDIDWTSSYDLAVQMANALEEEGATIVFRTEEGIGHWGWGNIYGESEVMEWLLSWERSP